MVWVQLTKQCLGTGCGNLSILGTEEAVYGGKDLVASPGWSWYKMCGSGLGLGKLVQVGRLQLERSVGLPSGVRASKGSP